MGEAIWFVEKSGREAARSIREACATYDRIIPPADLIRQLTSRSAGYASVYRSDGSLLS